MMTRAIAAAAVLAIVAGCSTTTARVDDGNTIITDATKRLIVTSKDKDGKRVVCAEPSPDAIASLALQTAIKANVPNANVNAELAASVARSVASIGIRTASIQILRDLGYRACEGVMNGVIQDELYKTMVGGVTDATLSLVAIEGLTQMPPAPLVVVGAAGSANVSGGDPTATSAAPTVQITALPLQGLTPQELGNVSSSVVEILKLHNSLRRAQLHLPADPNEKVANQAAQVESK